MEKHPLSGTLQGSGERVGLCDGSYIFFSEVVHVSSTYVSLVKSSPAAKPDIDGGRRYNPPPKQI